MPKATERGHHGQADPSEQQCPHKRPQSEGDIARREAANLAPPAHARHDDAGRPAPGDPVAMGWRDCHLHAFDIDGQPYGDRRTTDDVADENRLTLNGLLKSGIARFGYTYDFGDTWEHAVAIEKTQPAVNGSSYPACVAGKRNCPPEDCGGSWGYQHLMAVLADPGHPEHAEQVEWMGGEFNPDAFAIETADAMLAARFMRT